MSNPAQAAETAAFFAAKKYTPPCAQVPAPGSPPFAAFFDHTLLKLDATPEQFDRVCEEAKTYGFKTVCVRPEWVERCVRNLKSSSVLVSGTVGFHEGTYKTAEKVNEALQCVSHGAGELDMVMNYPLLKAGDYVAVQADIEAVRAACPHPTILKVIVETSQLSVEQIAKACEIVRASGADFIKTSTGFNGRGASVEDVQIMRYGVGDKCQIKASGGVKTIRDALAVIEAGADRIGASAGVAIMEEAKHGGTGQGGAGKGDGGY